MSFCFAAAMASALAPMPENDVRMGDRIFECAENMRFG